MADDPTTDVVPPANRFLEQFRRARGRNETLPPHAGLIVTRPLVEEADRG